MVNLFQDKTRQNVITKIDYYQIMKNTDLIKKICEDCIKEGEIVLKTEWTQDSVGDFIMLNPTVYVDLEKFKTWKSNCNVLINMLGNLAAPWNEIFNGDKPNTSVNASSIQGGLKSIRDTIEKGYLISLQDIIYAEAFANLIEQSEYLYDQNYFLAAGVIARAVLEEKLRNTCISLKVLFTKTKPTLGDYNTELYKLNCYSKIEFKNIDYLISIGNNAAHNAPLQQIEVKKLIEGVKDVLLRIN